MICWQVYDAESMNGYVKEHGGGVNDHKYYVGPYRGKLIADVWDYKKDVWHQIDQEVENVADGMQWCEMIESMGIY